MKITLATTEAERQACFDVRDAVFTIEQGITDPPDIDEYDADALHYLAQDETGVAGTARIVAKGETAKIGRVAVLKSHRGIGLGAQIMRAILDDAKARGFEFAALESQVHAIAFYERLGFEADGPDYDDGSGIMHRMMQAKL
ncbi:GNAT family N-acetyltransferase [Gymnodinialimonas hymeniacidonis]|uniref:GNAT family N-acetyltransferase n=1 Tax=Gymnodinialimonas hymeniacidonis TaxID=3126508 RepID=UPI0034C65E17